MKKVFAQVIFTCGREVNYQRNSLILDALRESFDVIEVTDDSRWMPLRYMHLYWKLAQALRNPTDLVVTGFLGQPLIPFIRKFTSAPILFDAFLSVYDTLSFERQVFRPDSVFGRFAYHLDQSGCNKSDLVTLDTNEHIQYFLKTFQLPEQKFKRVFVGCSEDVFYPRSVKPATPMVLFYGSYLRLQGVDVIVKAAKLLEKECPLRFRLIGEGPTKSQVCQFVKKWNLKNVDILPPVPLRNLPIHIAQAMICLGGHFGHAEKARRVISGKTYQMIAMGRPTIVGDNAANRELLTHNHDAWFCRMNDPEALAGAILHLFNSPELRDELSVNSPETFRLRASKKVLFPIWQELAYSLLYSKPSQ